MKRRHALFAGAGLAYWMASCQWPSGAQPDLGGRFSILHAFSGADGRVPFSGLTLSGDTLFGTTYRGGDRDFGVAFAIARDGSNYRVLHHFQGEDGRQPYHKLWVEGDRAYGITKFGGDADKGVLFEMGIDGAQFRVLHHFAGGNANGFNPHAGPILIGDRLYGTLYHGGRFRGAGGVYGYSLNTGEFVLLHSFDPSQSQHPTGRLTLVNGFLYGTASDFFVKSSFHRGSLYRLNPDGSEYETVYQFQGKADSGYPYDELMFDGDRYLYGTAFGLPGDVRDTGSLYRFDAIASELEVLHEFMHPQTEGSKPNGSLTLGTDGKLYGTTHGDNADKGTNFGTLFRMQPNGSEFEVLHRFTGGATGDTPMRTPAIAESTLFGTTAFGGGTQSDDTRVPTGYGLIYTFQAK